MKNQSESVIATNKQRIVAMITFCLICTYFIFLIYDQNFIFGSTTGNWTYSYFSEFFPIPIWIIAVVFLILSFVIFIGSNTIFKFEKITLFLSLIAVIVIQVLINSIYPIGIEHIIESDLANSFYSTAVHYTPIELLSRFIELVPSLPLHAKTNMPGKILIYQLLLLFTNSPKFLAYLIISISSLGSLVIYGICKRLFINKTVAYYGLILYALIPSKLCFFPILNTVTPLFILICLYLMILYLDTKKLVYLVFMGFALYALVLFEPSPLSTGLIFVSVLIHAIFTKQIQAKETIKIVLIPLIAFASLYLMMVIFFSFNLLQVLLFMLKDAANFNIRDQRGYWIWLFENTKSFALGIGLPVSMVFLYYIIEKIVNTKGKLSKSSTWTIENFYLLSMLLTYLAVLFLGINRGEITRLWIYLAGFMQIPAAIYLGKFVKSHYIFFCVSGLLVVQSMVMLQRVNFISP